MWSSGSPFLLYIYIYIYIYIYDCNNQISSKICCCFSGGMCIFLGFYFGYVGYFRSSLVEAVYAVFSAILFPPRSPIASAVFLERPLLESLRGIDCWLSCGSKKPLSILPSRSFTYVFCKGEKSIAFDIDSMSGLCRISHYIPLSFITEVKFIRSKVFISKPNFNVWKLWMKCFCVNMIGEIFNSWPNDLFGTNLDKIYESLRYQLLTTLQWTKISSIFSRCGTTSPFVFIFLQ